MRKWRIVVVLAVVLSTALVVASALLFDWRPLWYAWRGPLAMRAPELWPGAPSPARDPGMRVVLQAAGLVSQFVLTLLVAYAVPRHLRRMADAMVLPGRALLRFLAVGLVVAVAVTAVGFLAMLSFHTFPLTFLLAAAFFVAAFSGIAALSYQMGRSLLARAGWGSQSPVAGIGLGALILFALTRVPFFGLVVLIALLFLGAGAAFSTRFGSRQQWSLTPLVEETSV